jgi:elongation factor 1-gamma
MVSDLGVHMSELRIFSYLPNPRIWKATIAGRLCGVEIDVRGAAPRELSNWLWDFDARALSDADRENAKDTERIGRVGFKGGRLFKTDAFLEAHPFGTVPAAFSPDGRTGIFEPNSIMRTVARLGQTRFPLYGRDAYEASRIDSFLDVSLVFARDSQVYLLALAAGDVSPEVHAQTKDAFATYLSGIEQALRPDREFLVGGDVTLADICFACELSLFSNETARADALKARGLERILAATQFPKAMAHFARLAEHPAFAPDMKPYLAKFGTGAR